MQLQLSGTFDHLDVKKNAIELYDALKKMQYHTNDFEMETMQTYLNAIAVALNTLQPIVSKEIRIRESRSADGLAP